MDNNYKTILTEAQDNFVEKRSKFIGYIKPVKSEQEALDFINEKRSTHWDATHNVFAYILRDNNKSRCSDDGEPQGTAGYPVLDVMQKSGIVDAVIVVTRYFGGVLLGTGGLVRAYSNGAKIAIEAGKIINMVLCSECKVSMNYNQYGKINSVIPQLGGVVDDSDFNEDVTISFHIKNDMLDNLQKQLLELSSGEIQAEIICEKYISM